MGVKAVLAVEVVEEDGVDAVLTIALCWHAR